MNFKAIGWMVVAILVGIFVSIYFTGILTVPFHPDESTQLFMSSDFDLLLHAPLSMVYDPEQSNDLRQHYRELDAPLTKYILGFGRNITGLPPLSEDWDWGKTWQQNESASALPSDELLLIGRLSIALLYPLSLFFLFQTGKQMNGLLTGILAMLLLATNSLILLHTRRAMAEGVLIFTICFALWSFIKGFQYPWLAGLGVALAFNAKQSTLALVPIGVIAILLPPKKNSTAVYHWISALLQYAVVIILVTLALNPLFWKEPISTTITAWDARQDLLKRQVADAKRLAPETVLDTPTERMAVMVVNLYLGKPMFAEVGNYSENTAITEQAYLANPTNTLLRDPIGAGLLLFLSLFGISIALFHLIQKKTLEKRVLLIIMLATFVQAAALLWAIPLPWQRYSLPMIPFVCLWAAFGISQLIEIIKNLIPNLKQSRIDKE
jgi:4-amino-4-deoxy-L-arabinose transferase-like glycosyltransferase